MRDVRHIMERLNQAWRNRRFEELHQSFDENIVMRGPGLKELVRGRDAVVQSYVDFMARSEVIEYMESNHFGSEWQTTAVAGYGWSMTWIEGGKTNRESGQDMFVFEKRGSIWIAVLRVILF